MGEVTHIQWTDHTFNPWEGCTKVSPGCAHCYAETRNKRFAGGANWGKGAPRRRTSVSNWNMPLKWDRDARGEGKATLECPSCRAPWKDCECGFAQRNPRVFCASLADWLDDEVPIEWLADLLELIRKTLNLDWQLLTKRPENWAKRIEAAQGWHFDHGDRNVAGWLWDWLKHRKPPANVWIGTTVEDQQRADERIPLLLSIPAKVRFLSCEPLLGPLDLRAQGWLATVYQSGGREEPVEYDLGRGGIDWVICGGESGPGARPMHPDWARSLRNQCKDAVVAFFFKQWGEWVKYIDRDNDDPAWQQNYSRISNSDTFQFINLAGGSGFHGERLHVMQRVGKIAAGRIIDGTEHNDFPTILP